MLLSEITGILFEGHHLTLAGCERAVEKAEAELAEVKQQAASYSQSGSNKQYETKIERAKLAVKEAKRALQHYKDKIETGEADKVAAPTHKVMSDVADKRNAPDAVAKRKALSQKQSAAQELGHSHRGNVGDWKLHVGKVLTFIKSQHNAGKNPTKDDIAKHMDVERRVVDTWFNRKEYAHVKTEFNKKV